MPAVEESKRKASILVEALPYVRRFRGSIFVVKYGGSFMDSPDPAIRAGVAQDLVFLNFVGIRVVVVHGGGKAVTRELESRGLEAKFVNGLRITDSNAIEVVDEVLNGTVNEEVASFVASHDCDVQRIAGKQVLRCRKLEQDPDLGFVGEIKEVETDLILEALDAGKMPILSSTGSDDSGQCYNVNADTAAARVAMALGARRLVYLSDVPGLLRNPEDPDSLLSSLPVHQVQPLKEEGVIAQGMLPKVNSAVDALKSGVNRVHFIDGRLAHSILLEIFTDQGIGTEIVHS
ncbi:MAG: acetylglutamate kinase [Opitutae bacterium]|nr:acetylglutamate kinase [Opitutae bacterium]MEC7543621.1 acetylglutamate kinase [Verrucomicrobiota bacterium]MEC7628258.1 acetylglutamate kinase [Verrucomicrobiota bacterium]MEC8655386.1 acetylglutamate kinase [Verrucomicrobiota bacterium]MEC8777862.1 acetylglutamate kinase [Verrucomicrobiota bacterium]|tara:strand:+ start:185 stop:1054 length:870 start_codon:yes stop_codon:yes gene_type:complete